MNYNHKSCAGKHSFVLDLSKASTSYPFPANLLMEKDRPVNQFVVIMYLLALIKAHICTIFFFKCACLYLVFIKHSYMLGDVSSSLSKQYTDEKPAYVKVDCIKLDFVI